MVDAGIDVKVEDSAGTRGALIDDTSLKPDASVNASAV